MKLFYLISLSLTLTSYASTKWTASDVMKKNERARKIAQLKANGKIIIDGGSRKRMEKTFTWWRKIQKDGIHYNTLTKFHTPLTVKNQAILFLEAEGDKNEILMWLPTFKKSRMIESSQQKGSFMASDFSFSDITALQNEDYSYKELGIEKCPNDIQNKNLNCYKLTATLKNERSSDRLGYSKLLLWVRNDNFMSDRIHYFDESGKIYKELNTTKIISLSQETYFYQYLHMKNLTNGQFTILEFSEIDSKKKIPENLFFKQRLGKDD